MPAAMRATAACISPGSNHTYGFDRAQVGLQVDDPGGPRAAASSEGWKCPPTTTTTAAWPTASTWAGVSW